MSDRVVLITGAGRGIGAAAARAFADQGDRVVLMGRSAASITAVASGIGDRALALSGDVGRWQDMESAVAATVDRFGRLDVLINNAAVIAPIGSLAEVDPVEWASASQINLTGVFNGIRAALPVMLAQGGGTILTISSGAAHRPYPGWSAYCAAKAGAAMLTRSLHLEHGTQGIRAMGLSPGTVATDMQKAIKASGIGPVSELDWSDHVPPDLPARALVWMAGSRADRHLGDELSLREPWLREEIGPI